MKKAMIVVIGALNVLLSLFANPSDGQEWCSRPIRPGDTAKGVRFWNDYATLFHVAPVLSFDAVKGASRYEYAIARGDWSRTVGNGLPEVSLVPLWREMPKGTGWTVTCTAFGADGRAIGEAQVRKFTKAAAFEDVKLKPAAQSYRETARKAYMYMTSLPAMRTLVETGEPEQGYQHNAYVSKTHAAHVNAMLLWAEKMPECRDRALRYAKASAEYLLGEVEPADAVLAGWPPTYGRKPLRCDPKKAGEKDREAMVGNEPRAAVKYRKEVMLIYPAEVGLAFLRYHKATGDARFREAAARIAETFVRIRRPDGTWPLKMILATGEPVGQNVLVPSTLIGFFESLADASGDPRWQNLADECYSYLENGPFKTMNWDGQFEDIEPKPPYQNLTKHNALDGMFELLKRHPGDEDALRLARDLLRYSEDQFVFWEAPCGKDEAIPYPGEKARGPSPSMFKPGGYDYPSVFEQFNCYCSIDASVSKLIRAYLAMWRATGCEKDLRKARALGDQMTREQRPDGRIPTFWTNNWVGEVTYDWLNCMESSAAALLKLAEIEN